MSWYWARCKSFRLSIAMLLIAGTLVLPAASFPAFADTAPSTSLIGNPIGKIAAGADQSLYLRPDGAVFAWGGNYYGQLGDGTTIERDKPVRVKGLPRVKAIAAGPWFSLAADVDGNVWAWGYNVFGRLGDGTTTDRLLPVKIAGLPKVVAVAASESHALALATDGQVWAWGRNAGGELGDGTTDPHLTPVTVPNLTGVTAVSAGSYFSLALKSDGTVWSWGGNDEGELGDGTNTNRHTPGPVTGLTGVTAISTGQGFATAIAGSQVWAWGGMGTNTPVLGNGTTTGSNVPVRVTGLTGAVQVSAGNNHALARLGDGTVWAWGSNAAGMLGDGTTISRSTPVPVLGITHARSIAAGSSHSHALTEDGHVWGWGASDVGQAGDGSSAVRLTPAGPLKNLPQVKEISSGYSYTLALGADGSVWGWGENAYGEIGDGSTTTRIEPVRVPGLVNIKAVSAGASISAALDADGHVWTWGNNYAGSRGGAPGPDALPGKVPGLRGITAVAVGGSQVLAVGPDGSVWSWGSNDFGQLGDGTTTSRSTPKQISGLTDVKQVAAGVYHSLALKNDGTVWAWGNNYWSQLGAAPAPDGAPAPVTGLSGVVTIAAGTTHNLAIDADGRVWAWGVAGAWWGYRHPFPGGAIGPAMVPGLPAAAAIAGGYTHSLVVAVNGTLFAWGSNGNGELGDGTLSAQSAPQQVPGISGVTAASAAGNGRSFSIALKADGTVWSWGANYNGQLGDGTSFLHLVPQMALLPSGSSTPTWPAGSTLTATPAPGAGVALQWSPALDDEAVTDYALYQGDTLLQTVHAPVRTYQVSGLAAVQSYTFRVEAGDADGNWSTGGPSATVQVSADGPIRLVSRSGTDAEANGASAGAGLSGDGRYAALRSSASNLVDGDTNGLDDLFLYDRLTGQVERVSLAADGSQASGGASAFNRQGVINSNGEFVVFESAATNLVPGDTNGVTDIFVRDRLHGTTERVSVSSGGEQANGSSTGASISSDGRYAAFTSAATNLVPGKTNSPFADVYVRDRLKGTTERVSLAGGGTEGDGDSSDAVISADGRYVAFTSRAGNLAAGDTGHGRKVLVRDRLQGTTELVALSAAETAANGESYAPSITGDGRFIAFTSDARNLASADTGGWSQVYRRDRTSGSLDLVSAAPDGTPGSGPSSDPAIGAAGQYVAFRSAATNLVPGPTTQALVWDAAHHAAVAVSLPPDGGTPDGESRAVAVSADGSVVLFDSAAANLVAGDTNHATDVFTARPAFGPLPPQQLAAAVRARFEAYAAQVTAYKQGTAGPVYFDSAGLIWRVCADVNGLGLIGGKATVPALLSWFQSRGKETASPQPGDLVVWGDGELAGLYLGGGEAISALPTGANQALIDGGVVRHAVADVHAADGRTLPVSHFLRVDYDDAAAASPMPGAPVSGYVFDAETGEPVAGAAVSARIASTVTDVQGRFQFAGVPAGTGELLVSAVGWNPALRSLTVAGDPIAVTIPLTRPEAVAPGSSAVVRPVITGVDSDWSGPNRQAFFLNGVKLKLRFAAKVDWRGLPAGEIELQTPRRTLFAKDGAATLDMGSDFGPNGRLTVIAISADGTPSRPYDANVMVIPYPPMPTVLTKEYHRGDFGYRSKGAWGLPKLGKEQPLIPANIPLWGGNRVDFDTLLSWEAEVTSNGQATYQFMIHIPVSPKGSNADPGPSQPPGSNTNPDPVSPHSHAMIGPVHIEGDVGGKAELRYDPRAGAWRLVAGYLVIKVEGKAPLGPAYSLIGPIPVYIRGEVGIEGETELGITSVVADQIGFDGNLSLAPFGEAAAGVGLAQLLSGEAFLGAKGKATLQYPAAPTFKGFKLTVDFGVRFFAVVWKREIPAVHLEWTWPESGTLASLASRPSLFGPESFATANFTPIPRAYLTRTSGWTTQGGVRSNLTAQGIRSAQAASVDPAQEVVLQSAVFPDSAPALTALGSRQLLVYVADDPARPDLNQTRLKYTLGSGTAYGAPRPLFPADATADIAPEVAPVPGGALLAWQDLAGVLAPGATLDDALAQSEIAVARYDGASDSWSEPLRLTANGYLDRSPALATAGEKGLVVWVANQGGSMIGSATAPNDLMFSRFDGTAWSAAASVATGLGTILDGSLAYDGTHGLYVFAADADGNLETTGDQDLYAVTWDGTAWGPVTRITLDTVADNRPQVSYLPDGTPLLIWCRDGHVVYARGLAGVQPEPLSPVAQAAPTGEVRLAVGADGQRVVMFTTGSENGQQVYLSWYDSAAGRWSVPVQASRTPAVMRGLAAAMTAQGIPATVYNRVQMSTEQHTYGSETDATTVTMPVPGDTDLVALSYTPGSDLAVAANGVTVDPPNPRPGDTVTITPVIRNVGERSLADIPVVLYDGDPAAGGVIVASTTVPGQVAAGEVVTAPLTWTLPPDRQVSRAYVVVDPTASLPDRDRANNVAAVPVSLPDLAVVQLAAERMGPGGRLVTATIANLGGARAPRASVQVAYRDGAGEVPVGSAPVEPLAPGATQEVSFPVTGLDPTSAALAFVARVTPAAPANDAATANNALTALVDLAEGNQAAAPAAWPAGGVVPAGTLVSLGSATHGAAIYYTLDGSEPTTQSLRYQEPFPLQASATMRAVAVKAGLSPSWVAEFTYQTPPPGDLNGDGAVTVADLDLLVDRYGQQAAMPGWQPGFDLVPDGQVDWKDIFFLASRMP